MLVINYGEDVQKITEEALGASDILEYLKPSFSVAIKPNLVVSRPASEGATTHAEVVEGILRFLLGVGVDSSRISIIESAWVGDDTKRAFAVCGYERLQKKYGVRLYDLKDDACVKLEYKGVGMEVCGRALETDFLINVPVLKAHCQTRLTCNMKNLKGCIPDREKRRFHTLGLHKPIAALNALLKTGYCVVDGVCGDLTFEEGGNPTYANRVIVGRDPVMIDSYCAELIGYAPEDIEYLSFAKKWGLGEFFAKETQIRELNTENKPINTVAASRTAARYEKYIDENSACSACYAALIHALHRMGGHVGKNEKFYIGQGFRKNGDSSQKSGIGVGSCAKGFQKNIPGCPPKAVDIVRALSHPRNR